MMIKTFGRQNGFLRMLRDEGGNFAIMTAFALPVVLAAGGVAMDLANMAQQKAQLQDAADSAALAAASALVNKGITPDEAKELAKDFLIGQMTGQNSIENLDPEAAERLKQIRDAASVKIVDNSSQSAKAFDVQVNASLDVPYNALTQLLMAGLGRQEVPTDGAAARSMTSGASTETPSGYGRVSVTTGSESSTESKNAVSMFLVLDRSGSMGEDTSTINPDKPTKTETYKCGRNNNNTCTRTVTNYIIKIDALKSAATGLFATLNKADPDTKLVRTGGVSYNGSMQPETALAWGTSAVSTYVSKLTDSGYTNSSEAFKTAYQKVSATTEDSAHKNMNGQTPTKYIVFMTDGDNNQESADTETKKWCDAARAAKVEVYTVAFMAPDRGKRLLSYCATTTSHDFKAEDAEGLNAAFKAIGERASQLMTRLTY